MPACKSVSMYSKIRYMSLSFSALRTFNNLPSVQSIERSLDWVPLSVCGNNKWHLMIFSWLLTSCKNIISRNVLCRSIHSVRRQSGFEIHGRPDTPTTAYLRVSSVLKCVEDLLDRDYLPVLFGCPFEDHRVSTLAQLLGDFVLAKDVLRKHRRSTEAQGVRALAGSHVRIAACAAVFG